MAAAVRRSPEVRSTALRWRAILRIDPGEHTAMINRIAADEQGRWLATASDDKTVRLWNLADGRQLSQEDPAWGNGAFTKAVVEGLSGKADFQKSGKITHKGLDYYVTDRVKDLTRGQQSPVSIAPGGITDFPIAVVR